MIAILAVMLIACPFVAESQCAGCGADYNRQDRSATDSQQIKNDQQSAEQHSDAARDAADKGHYLEAIKEGSVTEKALNDSVDDSK
jgi:hypothetical protein